MNPLDKILNDIKLNGATPYYVGGYVRDSLLGVASKDIDIEVFGWSYQRLADFLSAYGRVDLVGKSFGTIKFYSNEIADDVEFSIPRRESKNGVGHTGFAVEFDPNISLKDALSRRDFTINSIAQNPFTKELIDPFGGIQDLKDGVLSATSDSFGDDPLRVLRGFQFCSRFNLRADHRTSKACFDLIKEYEFLSLDRVRGEWFKWALRGKKLSAGLQFLIDTGWSKLYPEFHNILGVKQNPVWHPEIFVGLHTQYVCDEASAIADRENLSDDDRLTLVFSALTHDFAKFTHSQGKYPNITSRGHDRAGAPLAELLLYRIGAPAWLINKVKPLVAEHMAYISCGTPKAARNLAVRLEPANITELLWLIEADHSGRPPLRKGLPTKATRLLELSKQESILGGKQKSLIQGRHLQALGETPSPFYGYAIKEAYKAQVLGLFKNEGEALDWLKDNFKYLKGEFTC